MKLIVFILVLSIPLLNNTYAFENNVKSDKIEKDQGTVNLLKNDKTDSNKEKNNDENLKKSSAPSDETKDSKNNKDLSVENKPKDDEAEKADKPKIRSLKFEEAFIITDKTIANTFRIDSEKKWFNYKDELLIIYDIFGQKNDDGKMLTKKHRIEFNYKLYASNLKAKDPFVEYCYSSDQPTRLKWKVLSGGIGKKLPFDIKFDIGYGYKWGEITEEETYEYDVVTLNLNNKRKISKFTLSQNLKAITPRSTENNKHPIYDYKSSFSTPITKNLDGAINFDWRYQKLAELKKEDWFNYSLKFGLKFIPRK